jgi:thymidylate kinase
MGPIRLRLNTQKFNMEERGRFIVIYGPNNIGKSEQVRRLADGLRELGLSVVNLKYPIYDLRPTGPILNAILREGNPFGYTQEETQQIFADNRADFEPTLKGLLARNYWPVAEDYTGTGIAWGLTYGVPMQKLLDFNKDLLKEDFAICLDGERFSSGIEKQHANEQGDNWELNRAIHRELSVLFGWEVINANQSREKVATDILKAVKGKFNLT